MCKDSVEVNSIYKRLLVAYDRINQKPPKTVNEVRNDLNYLAMQGFLLKHKDKSGILSFTAKQDSIRFANNVMSMAAVKASQKIEIDESLLKFSKASDILG
jgi:hypothetical protein